MSLLEVKDLIVHFHDARPERFAVGGISFSMEEGEILGLVGESGSGKTVTAMCLSGLLPVGKADKGGSITLDGHEIFACSEKELNRILGREMTVVFQEPMTSFNPLYRIGRQIEEGLYVHEKKLSAAERKERALDAMARSGLNDPEQVYRKYPHELSGGMLQRAMIAAAIVTNPKLLIADEPTTALDVTVQAQILELLRDLNRKHHMAILFISHDLNVVRKLCENVIVMKRGLIVERGKTRRVFRRPEHPYTQELIAAIPGRERLLYRDEAEGYDAGNL